MKLYPLGSLCLAVISLSLLPFISRKQKIQPADGRRERERQTVETLARRDQRIVSLSLLVVVLSSIVAQK